jgi:hypothetical protein
MKGSIPVQGIQSLDVAHVIRMRTEALTVGSVNDVAVMESAGPGPTICDGAEYVVGCSLSDEVGDRDPHGKLLQ